MFADDTKVFWSTIKTPEDYKPLKDDIDSLTA